MARLCKTSAILSNLRLRRAVPVLAATFALAGCSVLGRGDFKSFYELSKKVWNGDTQSITLEQASAVPYASMGIRLGGGPQAMIVLASDTSGQSLWTSAAKIAITTKDGRIVRTGGLEKNLGGLAPLSDGRDKDGVGTVRWQADFPDLVFFSVPITCQDRSAGGETIIILGSNIRTRRIEESCVSEYRNLDWSFHNTYWLDPSNGLVWRSVQHIHPGFDTIETEILRAPA